MKARLKRLVDYYRRQLKHANKTAKWVLENVIQDLEGIIKDL